MKTIEDAKHAALCGFFTTAWLLFVNVVVSHDVAM